MKVSGFKLEIIDHHIKVGPGLAIMDNRPFNMTRAFNRVALPRYRDGYDEHRVYELYVHKCEMVHGGGYGMGYIPEIWRDSIVNYNASDYPHRAKLGEVIYTKTENGDHHELIEEPDATVSLEEIDEEYRRSVPPYMIPGTKILVKHHGNFNTCRGGTLFMLEEEEGEILGEIATSGCPGCTDICVKVFGNKYITIKPEDIKEYVNFEL